MAFSSFSIIVSYVKVKIGKEKQMVKTKKIATSGMTTARQNKTAVRYHSTATGWANIKRPAKTIYARGFKKTELILIVGGGQVLCYL